jgi:hypothetical protein
MTIRNILTLAAVLGTSSAAFGGFSIILGENVVSGAKVNTPADVSANATLEEDIASVFTERGNVFIDANTEMADIVGPLDGGTYSVGNANTQFLPEGEYASYFVYANSTMDSVATTYTFKLEFSEPILGLIFLDSTLASTADPFGKLGVNYLPSEGIENVFDVGTGDSMTVTVNQSILEVTLTNLDDVDALRVLTAVPEPSHIIGAVAFGFIGLSLLRRRLARK